jgi:hypothetical protein
VILRGLASVLGAVVLAPPVQLIGTCPFGFAAAVGSVAGADLGEGTLGAADGVGCLGGAGRAYLVFAAALWFARGGVADVFEVGLGRVGMWSGFDSTVVVGPLMGDVVEVVLVADFAVRILLGVGGTPCLIPAVISGRR